MRCVLFGTPAGRPRPLASLPSRTGRRLPFPPTPCRPFPVDSGIIFPCALSEEEQKKGDKGFALSEDFICEVHSLANGWGNRKSPLVPGARSPRFQAAASRAVRHSAAASCEISLRVPPPSRADQGPYCVA